MKVVIIHKLVCCFVKEINRLRSKVSIWQGPSLLKYKSLKVKKKKKLEHGSRCKQESGNYLGSKFKPNSYQYISLFVQISHTKKR